MANGSVYIPVFERRILYNLGHPIGCNNLSTTEGKFRMSRFPIVLGLLVVTSLVSTTTGKPLWSCQGFNGRGTPAPAWGNGLLYVVNGKSGDVYAVKPGGTGNLSFLDRNQRRAATDPQ